MTSRQYLVLAVLLGALTAFAPVSIDMYLPSFPTLQRDFAGDPGLVQATLSLFFVGLAIGQGIYGPISDRFGRKPPLYIGIALYIAGSIMAVLTPSLEGLVAARFVQGIGGCAGIVIARAIVRDLFDERDSARMLATLMLVMGLAPILAPIVGGQLLAAFGWQSIFWVLTGFGVFCLTLTALALRESLPPEKRQPGGVGVALRNYWLLMRDPRFLAYVLIGTSVMSALFAYLAGSPFVFIELHGVRPERYGFLFGINAIGLVGASQINHWLLLRYSGRTVLRAATIGFAVAAVLVGVNAVTGIGGFIGLLVPLFFSVASLGFIAPNTAAAAMSMHGRIAGAASAVLGILQYGIGALAAALVGVFADGSARPMGLVIAACGLFALALQQFYLRSAVPPQPAP
jgi:DHA1 family bicyclomycin/chloramphenicol resistance-like MFS transporter